MTILGSCSLPLKPPGLFLSHLPCRGMVCTKALHLFHLGTIKPTNDDTLFHFVKYSPFMKTTMSNKDWRLLSSKSFLLYSSLASSLVTGSACFVRRKLLKRVGRPILMNDEQANTLRSSWQSTTRPLSLTQMVVVRLTLSRDWRCTS